MAINQVTIYTDGACSGNPGPGGWGAILMAAGHKKELSGGEKQTTNNRMELTAVIRALEALKFPCEVQLYSDSSYVINAFQLNWLRNWKRNGWKNASGQEVSNRDLWEELDRLAGIHQIKWNKVKGHSDNEFNNRCDELAVQATARIKEGLEP